MYSQFSGAVIILESSAQKLLLPTANLLIIPEPLFFPDCLCPVMVSIISPWS